MQANELPRPESASPTGDVSSNRARRQRLIVCLDGTWNNRDDNTNVLHHFELVRRGMTPDGFLQKAKYDEGVGTGVLDRITGGGFGFGLEENVREAYNWLVQNYQEGSDPRNADEIYIFGFSRGAYTARSLVGFIGRCGLLRRGAPLTVTQLWEQYCILGRQHEERTGRLEQAFGEGFRESRQITDLVCDPWQIKQYETRRRRAPAQEPDDPDRVPGQRANGLTETEKLLVRWSRRVRITYLGVYDTVGAMGFDALAIPGLKSKLALHHNMRPTTLIQSCRHALAIDEHRSSFSHTPFVAYVGHESAGDEQARGEAAERLQREQMETEVVPKPDWQRIRAMWQRKIEQCWFVGAHSNIGGGYADNRLAAQPLAWIFEGATKAGLVCEPLPHFPPLVDPLPPPRDSYAEFVRPFWTMLFRAKPYFRPIAPEPELRAAHKDVASGTTPPGFALESINEQVDPSVFSYWADRMRPPNLAEYAVRKLGERTADARNCPTHSWLGDKFAPHLVLLFWAVFAALGVAAVREFVLAKHGVARAGLWVLAGFAFLFAMVDWGESKVNFSIALGPSTPPRRAFLDSIYWTRAIGVVLCVIGLLAALDHLWLLGWNEYDFAGAWSESLHVLARWWWLFAGAGGGALLATLAEGGPARRRLALVLAALVAAPLIALAVIVGLVFATCFLNLILSSFWQPSGGGEAPAENAAFAGLLVLLQLGIAYLLRALSWCGEPMQKANLGSIVALQFCATPRQVHRQIEQWCRRLCRRQHVSRQPWPECSMANIVSEAIWRDIIGLVPVYALVLGFGLWFAADSMEWSWLAFRVDIAGLPVPTWLLVIVGTAAADYVENTCHLRYLKLHARDRLPGVALTSVSFAATLIKTVGFLGAALLTLAAVVAGSWLCAVASDEVGWRGLIAVAITFAGALALLALGIGAGAYRAYTDWKRRQASSRAPTRT